jgi:hypothetical protein
MNRTLFVFACALALAASGPLACDKSGDDTAASSPDETASNAPEETNDETNDENTDDSDDSDGDDKKDKKDKKDKADKEKEDDGEKGSKAAAVGLDKAKSAFPKELAGFKLDGVKEKKQSDDWIEYRATYKGKGGKIKLVINEHLPGINPDWKKRMKDLEKEDLNGREAAFQKKDDKRTYMVIVKPRFRVDIKSRDASRDALKAVAKAFDYKAVKKLGK